MYLPTTRMLITKLRNNIVISLPSSISITHFSYVQAKLCVLEVDYLRKAFSVDGAIKLYMVLYVVSFYMWGFDVIM